MFPVDLDCDGLAGFKRLVQVDSHHGIVNHIGKGFPVLIHDGIEFKSILAIFKSLFLAQGEKGIAVSAACAVAAARPGRGGCCRTTL